MLSLLPTVATGEDIVRFDQVDLREGASRSAVTGITQDKKGYMWFSTRYGLYKYDGYEFTFYTHDPDDPDSLSSNSITCLFRDLEGNIWIGTETGNVDRIDLGSEQFLHFSLPTSDLDSIRDNPIEDFFINQTGDLLVIVRGGGWARYDSRSDKFVLFEGVPLEPVSFHGHKAVPALEDSQGMLWFNIEGIGQVCIDRDSGRLKGVGDDIEQSFTVSTWGESWLFKDSGGKIWVGVWGVGLFNYDVESNDLVPVQELSGQSFAESAKVVHCVIEDSSGNLWMGTTDSGLIKVDPVTGEVNRYFHSTTVAKSLSSNNIECLYEDASGTIWVGTQNGLNKYSKYKYKFNCFDKQLVGKGDEAGVFVFALYEDSDEALWVGTLGKGLLKYDKGSGQYKSYDLAGIGDKVENTVLSLLEDSRGDLYVGTAHAGLLRLKQKSGRFERLSEPLAIADIHEDRNGVIWIATFVKGLGRLDRENGTFKFLSPPMANEHTLGSFDATVIFEDRKGYLWVGSDGSGLVQIFPDRKTYKLFTYNPDYRQSLSDDHVLSIFGDEKGVLWIGTQNGLNKLDTRTGTFKRYHVQDGLPDNVICGILRDNEGNLWLSTFRGLARFDPQTEQSSNYDINDGLPSNEFNAGAYHKGKSGELFFGGVNGLINFRAQDLLYNPHKPNIVLTSFSKFSEEVTFQKPVDEIGEITLDHTENIISFEFSALDFNEPERNLYAYRLKGLHDEWIFCGNERRASYTHIPPGNYIFMVKGSNNDDVWNESGVQIQVVILPPFWITWEFRTFLILAIIGAVVTAHKLRTRAIKRRSNLLQKEVDERRIAEGRLLANQARLRSLASELTLAEERERRRISLALHDHIGHALLATKVKLATESASTKDESTKGNLQDVITTLEEAIKHTRSLTVEISPPSLYKYGFETAAEGLVERFGTEYGIKSVISIATGSPPDEETSVLLYQALRELLVNVLKHAEADTIKVLISNDEEKILVKVKDNGKGFDIDKVLAEEGDSRGFGLYSISERLESIGGTLLVSSELGVGTEITIVAPISREGEGRGDD